MKRCKSHDLADKLVYYYHLDGLKGVACLLVMVGHYLGLYKYAQSFVPPIPIIDILKNSQFSFLIDEGYWLYLFFVVSGYLVSKSKITSIVDVIIKSISRFLRLALPILFSYCVIYLIYIVAGFYTTETNTLFRCQWYQNYYTGVYTIKDVLLGPLDVLLFGKNLLNPPYWVMRMMFVSSLLIYFLKLIFTKLNTAKHEALLFSMLIIITLASCFVSPIITACFIGMLVSFYENSEIKSKSCYAFWFIFIAMLIYILPGVLKSVFFFASLIIFIPRIKVFENIFSSKPARFIGKLSWGIYSFHWPIICSFGALSIVELTSHIGLVQSYFVSFIFVLMLTLVCSIYFYYTFERFSFYLTKKVNGYLLKFMNSIPKINN